MKKNGFGLMHLPQTDLDDRTKADKETVQKMIFI